MAKSKKFESATGNVVPSKTEIIERTSVLLQSIVEGDKPDYQYIKIDAIHLNPNNDYALNDNEQGVIDLANDIKINGLLHNIVVSLSDKGEYTLLSGERRLLAYRYLRDNYDKNKYDEIYALIRKNLTQIDEMLILDAANLQTRGGLANERRFRKSSVRFVENIKKRTGVDNDLAVSLTKQYIAMSDGVIDKNLLIEHKLNKDLLSLFDEGLISKVHAYEYSMLDEELQDMIAENLMLAKDNNISSLKDLNAQVYDKVKETKKLDDSIVKQQKLKKEIDADVNRVETEINNSNDANKIKQLNEEKASLQKQGEIYQKVMEETQRSLEENKEALINAMPHANEKVSSDIWDLINHKLQKVEKDVQLINKKGTIKNIALLQQVDKTAVLTRIDDCITRLMNFKTMVGGMNENSKARK